MITSTSNQRVKELSQIQKKSKIRSREGIFIAEGIRMVRETPHERLVGLYFSESFEKKYGKEVLDVISGGDLKVREQIRKKTEILSDAVFSYVSDTKTPQGVLAVVHQMEYTLGQIDDLRQSAGSGQSGNNLSNSGGCRSDRYHNEPGLRGYLQPKDDPLHHGSTLPDAVFVCG